MGHQMLPIAFFPDRPPLPWQQNLGQNWLQLPLRKRFLRDFFPLQGGFQGWAIECCQLHFSPTDHCCDGNEIWDKIGYNSLCVRDICEIFASRGGFCGWANECCQSKFSPTAPRCNGNEIWDKMGYNRLTAIIGLRLVKLALGLLQCFPGLY